MFGQFKGYIFVVSNSSNGFNRSTRSKSTDDISINSM